MNNTGVLQYQVFSLSLLHTSVCKLRKTTKARRSASFEGKVKSYACGEARFWDKKGWRTRIRRRNRIVSNADRAKNDKLETEHQKLKCFKVIANTQQPDGRNIGTHHKSLVTCCIKIKAHNSRRSSSRASAAPQEQAQLEGAFNSDRRDLPLTK